MRDRLGRFELLLACQAAGRQLQSSGESNRHIDQFLAQLQQLPGEDVGELFMHWHRRQSEQRLTWALLIFACTVLAGVVSHVLLGWVASLLCVALLASLGIRDQQLRFQAEMAWSTELDLRAQHALHRPGY